MRYALKLHPDSRGAAAIGIEVDVAHPRPRLLALRYLVTGATNDLVLPPPAASTRADELWRHTCFEAFVGAPPGDGYCEFNFAPSSQWAAYWFTGYRSGMTNARGVGAPRIETRSSDEGYELRATFGLDRLAVASTGAPWRLGLCAVIEDTNGGKSYWALAHPPGKADFHHSDGFAIELAAAERR